MRAAALRIHAWLAIGLALHGAPAPAADAPRCPPTVTAAGAGNAGAPSRDYGFLWRITRDGRSSYLYGTLHVGRPGWRRFGPQVTNALRASDVLALEIDPDDPELQKAMADARPPQELPPALQRRLSKAYSRACIAEESMAAMHAVLQVTSLTVMEARWFGMDPGFALERLLANHARALGRRIVSLETVAQQTQALVPDDEAEARVLVDRALQQLEDEGARRVLSRMATAWEQGDLSTLSDYDKWCECVTNESERGFLREINDDRNPGLADGIEAQHRQGRRVFAAVGALHMTGPQALPALLARRGFRVERVPFTP